MANILTKKPRSGSMPLTGHLKELRNRLAVVGIVFFVVACLTLTKADVFVEALMSMAKATDAGNLYSFVAIAPQEKLIQYFRVSIVAAIIVTIPLALYEIWAFAKPGLKKTEYRFFGFALLFGLVMFCVGAAFAYKVTLPFMLNFLATVGDTENAAIVITSNISVESYITFVLTIFIIFGCVFEMPLLSVILSKLGIASQDLMRKGRGIAIVIIFVIAAIITPPDIVSQILVAVPMVLLYELSIGLAMIFYKPHTADDEDADEDDEDDEEEDDED